jgi:hypothetical protein
MARFPLDRPRPARRQSACRRVRTRRWTAGQRDRCRPEPTLSRRVEARSSFRFWRRSSQRSLGVGRGSRFHGHEVTELLRSKVQDRIKPSYITIVKKPFCDLPKGRSLKCRYWCVLGCVGCAGCSGSSAPAVAHFLERYDGIELVVNRRDAGPRRPVAWRPPGRGRPRARTGCPATAPGGGPRGGSRTLSA